MPTFGRRIDDQLAGWLGRPGRRPLVLRGARQTGKTTAVRQLGSRCPLMLELNLERPDDLALVRSCRSASELLERLQQEHNLASLQAGTLLFLDEIQEHPEALSWLRFLYEDHPELAVVAAGSLLEVRLKGETSPFPVGRVEFLRVEPATFFEFLRATGDDRIADDLDRAFERGGGVDPGLHELAMERLRRFLLVGGLPEAVDVWRQTSSLVEVGRIHGLLRQAYHEDLRKYGAGRGTRHLETVLANAPAQYGARFKLRQLGPGERDAPLREAIELLEKAMVLYRVEPTGATELPLVSRARAARKLLPLDVGLALSELRIRPEQLADRAVETLLGGRVAEAFVGVQLLAAHAEESRFLRYWARDAPSSSAEVDFLVATSEGVLPVEVKSGKAGRLRSLHRYLLQSGSRRAVRLSAASGTVEQLQVEVEPGRSIDYRLESLPLYLAERLATR